MSLTIEDRIPTVAREVAAGYRRYVEPADVYQELMAYVFGDGKKALEKLVKEGDEFRIQRALYGAAKQFCEREKAAQSGYSFDDVAWYSPVKLADLIPLALDPEWDGLTGEGDEASGFGAVDGREGGTLLAMVADVRRVLGTGWSVSRFNPETESGLANLEWLADRLGGEFPESPGYQRGRRRAISNAKARAITEGGYAA